MLKFSKNAFARYVTMLDTIERLLRYLWSCFGSTAKLCKQHFAALDFSLNSSEGSAIFTDLAKLVHQSKLF